MNFKKMSLRGKIVSAIIIAVIVAILVNIGVVVYKNTVKATTTSVSAEENIVSEDKNEFWNVDIANSVDENQNKVDDKVENKTIEENTSKNENTESQSKTSDNKESEISKKDSNSSSSKTSDSKSTNNKEKTAATEGKKGTIYLTFDDGPSTNITPKILDILKEQNVKATFFILNYNSEGEKIIKRAYQEGHSIGIHGYSHKYSEIYQTENTYMNNLNSLQEKIEKSIGFKSRITRFPGGSSNTISKKYNVGIMSKLVKKVEANGYKYYDWNIDSNDAGSAKTSAKVYSNVTKNLSKKRPNVVLMHDFSNGKKSLNALRDIIKYAKSNGYVFEKITYEGDLVAHHNVNN